MKILQANMPKKSFQKKKMKMKINDKWKKEKQKIFPWIKYRNYCKISDRKTFFS